VLEYTSDKRLSIDNQDVTLPELDERLRDLYEDRWDKMMFVIDAAKGAGVTRVAIVTERMRGINR
jgi:biopolymer transport protein ExbD